MIVTGFMHCERVLFYQSIFIEFLKVQLERNMRSLQPFESGGKLPDRLARNDQVVLYALFVLGFFCCLFLAVMFTALV